MLVVTVEMYPFGDESAKRILSKIIISNNGGNTDPEGYHTYNVELVESDHNPDDPPYVSTQITFNRDRGHLALVREALLELEITE